MAKYESLQYYAQDYSKGHDYFFYGLLKRPEVFAAATVHQYCGRFCLMESIVFWIDDDADKTGDAADANFICKSRNNSFLDAGHELKTPLTIISANADILQDEIGEN